MTFNNTLVSSPMLEEEDVVVFEDKVVLFLDPGDVVDASKVSTLLIFLDWVVGYGEIFLAVELSFLISSSSFSLSSSSSCSYDSGIIIPELVLAFVVLFGTVELRSIISNGFSVVDSAKFAFSSSNIYYSFYCCCCAVFPFPDFFKLQLGFSGY